MGKGLGHSECLFSSSDTISLFPLLFPSPHLPRTYSSFPLSHSLFAFRLLVALSLSSTSFFTLHISSCPRLHRQVPVGD